MLILAGKTEVRCGHAGAGGAGGPMALVPVMLQGPDGTVTSAYQLQPVQPVPPFYPQEAPPASVSGAVPIAH